MCARRLEVDGLLLAKNDFLTYNPSCKTCVDTNCYYMIKCRSYLCDNIQQYYIDIKRVGVSGAMLLLYLCPDIRHSGHILKFSTFV